MFENPDMSQALMAEWSEVRQKEDEDYGRFMARVQAPVQRAFLGHTDPQRQKLAVQAFCRGMIDQALANS